MRQAQEDDVVSGEDLRCRVLQDPVGQREQMGMVRTQERPGIATRGERADLEFAGSQTGVPAQQPEYLATRVAARAGHRHPHLACRSHVIIMQQAANQFTAG